MLLVLVSLLAFSLPYQASSQGQGSPVVTLVNQYLVGRYGFAVINETVTFNNTSSATAQIPNSLQLGLPGSIGSKLTSDYSLTGSGFMLTGAGSNGTGFLVSVTPSQSTLQAGTASSFSVKGIVKNIVNVTSRAVNIFVLQSPSTNFRVDNLKVTIQMPSSTFLSPVPAGFASSTVGGLPSYKNSTTPSRILLASAITATIQQVSTMDFHPLHVFAAKRTITASSNGIPEVQDFLSLKNVGSLDISSLKLSLLSSGTGVTVVPSGFPPLLNPTLTTLTNGAIDLTRAPFQAPIVVGANFTATLLYNLQSSYFSTSGGQVSVSIPRTPPIASPVDVYTLTMSLPSGLLATQLQTSVVKDASLLTQGTTNFGYSITLGWASDRAIPAASVIFFAALIGLLISSEKTEETEEEEVGMSEHASDMVKAFEAKTDLINTMFEEIQKEEQSNLNKAYFDDLRSRLDTFRSRALQRLNEAKQKSATKKFLGLLNQLHDAEREVDMASKDMLNLYEQYYMKRMREETFLKLQPNYKKRLGGAVNHLSDLLNVAQREAKLV
jgi:hypothetical protein